MSSKKPDSQPDVIPPDLPVSPDDSLSDPPKPGRFAEELARSAGGAVATDPVGLARLAGASLWRAMGAITRGGFDTAGDIAREVRAGEPITDIVDHRVEQVRSAAVSALGLADSESAESAAAGGSRTLITASELKHEGDAMLYSGWNPEVQPRDLHPSFATILHALTPDEARIIRFLSVAGSQPSIDIRTKTPFGVGSVRLAGGISMIAQMAGCTWPDRDHHYMANLNRLGLVRFSEEPVEDFRRYSLIEAQPVSQAAFKQVGGKAISVYRSIYLSLFGEQFAETCFTLTGYNAGGWDTDDRGDVYLGKGPRLNPTA
ncbi:Abi-alpha family protein [Skermania piniformis]|uniref:DUF4393 domain-containing protein n=1 Tax=Skermania pinensis TaxID=39122 RepID=A0ABX8S5H4_9ACTN|nr:Abi-alpha family protein [Skermania piniformis]QXQ13104.1 DUF4393 domain-containing protein [Skermania piniformis]